MAINAQPAPMTVADYCNFMGRKEISINSDYQRSDKVWPPAARSFLIESILQGYPIPKFFLFQKTDLKSKKTVKEIVDGQQRSKAIFDYFNNEFAIAKGSELSDAKGKRYDQLSPELQEQFLGYPLSIDLFVSATPEDIREAFRRLNSYTIPLNPEEKRNANFQGAFKWFVYQLSREYEQFFIDAGVFGTKQIVRMQDTKLFSDVIFALLHGLKTTKGTHLDGLYKELNTEFPFRDEIDARLRQAFELIASMTELFDGGLMKPHVFYSYVLAMTHTIQPCSALTQDFAPPPGTHFDRDIVTANLSRLAQSLEEEPGAAEFPEFAEASRAKTNVEGPRRVRFQWICKALQPKLL